ncbi:hypothetical protein [Halanaerobium hydrogeniformans]|uniref:XRE family transcriptional regulator n=1 Tax=Halanaerobium hydrogeniformans TaxID=656519 RepID=E4RIZ3_HALHG|nr:hypothetical protein [Halanaerobium hydrogeniformans]ADQ15213.1 hypothetical protein Halsa_1795 [Halanaerobium hydrogeniformans]
MTLDGLDCTELSKKDLITETENRILYGLIFAEKMPFNLLAQKLDVSVEELHEWCCEGKVPEPEVREKLSNYFDLPEQILFWEAEH